MTPTRPQAGILIYEHLVGNGCKTPDAAAITNKLMDELSLISEWETKGQYVANRLVDDISEYFSRVFSVPTDEEQNK